MPKPTPDAQDPEVFGREVERVMSGQAEAAGAEGAPAAEPPPAAPLPAPPEPATTAPFVFDPAATGTAPDPAAPAPEKKPRRALWGTKAKQEENKPSMFPAPAADAEENGENP